MAIEMYDKARKIGLRAYKKDVSQGKYPYLPVLDDIINKEDIAGEVSLGLADIPLDRVVGTSTAGRTQAFASNFMPLMENNTEFGSKWSLLSDAHVNEGIRDPIKVYEYLNYYYVVEGNKRVSVLKFFEADSIHAFVTRKVPKPSDDKEIRIYYEYMDFHKKTGVNFIWFSNEGEYKQLIDETIASEKFGGDAGDSTVLSQVGTATDSMDGSGIAVRAESSKMFSEDAMLELKASYRRFDKAYKAKGGNELENISIGDAYLAFVKVEGFDAVCEMGVDQIEEGITAMWQEFLVLNSRSEVEVSLDPPEEKKSVISQIRTSVYSAARPLKTAFIYDTEPMRSDWLYTHELGRNHIKEVFQDKISTLKVVVSDPDEDAVAIMEDLIENEGVEVIFTPSLKLIDASLKCAIKYPDVKVLNCSLNTSHRYIRTYEARLYEAKFLSGMVAGMLTETDKIGYLADYPIYGTTANINAFALGAKMVNPRAEVYLRWSTVKENSSKEEIYKSFLDEGIDFVSDQEMITPNKASRNFGLYKVTIDGPLNMTMATYNWGIMYEKIINIIMRGEWVRTDADDENKPINYWWGLSAGVVDIILSEKVPVGTRRLVNSIRNLMVDDKFSAFGGEVVAQDGSLRNEEGSRMEIDDIIKMNWLADNVNGSIPELSDLKDRAKPIVEMKGVQKESE